MTEEDAEKETAESREQAPEAPEEPPEPQTLADLAGATRKNFLKYLLAAQAVITFFLAPFVFSFQTGLALKFFLWILLALAAGMPAGYLINRAYRKRAKNSVIAGLAQEMGLFYSPSGTFPLVQLDAHRILPPYDRAFVEDGFEGQINGAQVAFQEARLLEVEMDKDNEGRDRETEYAVFHGVIIRVQLGKQLDYHTVLMTRRALKKFLRTKFSKFESVGLVSPKFRKKYDVISTDQVESRYIFDPTFIESFIEAASRTGMKWMEASFRDREAVFILHFGKDQFELPGIWTRPEEKHFQSVRREVETISSFVETLRFRQLL